MENLELGLYTTALGMFIVFLGLVFLMYIMMGLSALNKPAKKPAAPRRDEGMREKVEAVTEENAVEIKEQPSAPQHGQDTVKADATGEVAAIAAVMAILMSEGASGVVTSVRQIGAKTSPWAFAGRRDIMASRL